MELDEFIKTAVVSLVNGVEKASEILKRDIHLAKNAQDNKTINFDVSVSVEKSGDASIGGIINVVGLSAGLDLKCSETNRMSVGNVTEITPQGNRFIYQTVAKDGTKIMIVSEANGEVVTFFPKAFTENFGKR